MKLRSEILSQTELTKIKHLCALDRELITADTEYHTHGYHPYSAKYIPQIPSYLIKNFSEKNDLILDNFAGSGTTLVESKLQNIPSIGIEANPFVHFASSVKTDWNVDSIALLEIAKKIKDNAIIELEKQGISDTPSLKNEKADSLRQINFSQFLQLNRTVTADLLPSLFLHAAPRIISKHPLTGVNPLRLQKEARTG